MSWTASVACAHRAALGRPDTVQARAQACQACAPAVRVGQWQLAVHTVDPVDAAPVIAEVRAAHSVGLGVAVALVRVATRHPDTVCSVLLADSDELAALSWGRPLHVCEVDAWEYLVSAEVPLDDAHAGWAPAPPGSVLALAPCGPTPFRLGPPPSADTLTTQEASA